jgi:hypothetical protein
LVVALGSFELQRPVREGEEEAEEEEGGEEEEAESLKCFAVEEVEGDRGRD